MPTQAQLREDDLAAQASADMVLINGIPLPTRQTRKQIVVSTLIFCWTIIIYVVGWGSPTNSLHESAMAWAWGASLAVVSAYVFGAVIENFSVMKSNATVVKK